MTSTRRPSRRPLNSESANSAGFTRRGLLLVLATALLVVAVTVLVLRWHQVAPQRAQDRAASLLQNASDDTAKASGSISELDRLAEGATDPKDQAAYRQAQAEVALQVPDYEAALKAALESERLAPTVASAAVTGYAYAGIGDKKNAIKYFRLAAERSPKSELGRGGANEYETRARELEAAT